jgi:hypothetical protein
VKCKKFLIVAVLLLAGAQAAYAADTLRLAFSSFSATNAGFFTALEEKLFDISTRQWPPNRA